MQPVLTPATNVKFSGSAYVRDVLQLHVGDFISSLIRAVEILMKVLFQARLLSVFDFPISFIVQIYLARAQSAGLVVLLEGTNWQFCNMHLPHHSLAQFLFPHLIKFFLGLL